VGVKNGWLPQLIGALGVFIAVMSLMGFSGAYFDSIGMPFLTCLVLTYYFTTLSLLWVVSIGMLGVNGCVQSCLGITVLVFGAVCLADAKHSGKLMGPTWEVVKQRFVNVCPECDLLNTSSLGATGNTNTSGVTAYTNTTAATVGTGSANYSASSPSVDIAQDPMMCCGQRASLVVWNNLTLLGVALSTTLISIVVNALSSIYLYRTLRRDRMSPLDEEEMEGLQSRRRGSYRSRPRGSDDDDYM
jgi:hypothetical protein